MSKRESVSIRFLKEFPNFHYRKTLASRAFWPFCIGSFEPRVPLGGTLPPALKKKLTVNFFQKCTQLKLAPVPGSARNLRKSYRGIFEKTPYMYSMGVLADIVFFFRLQYGKPLASIPGNHWETNTIFFFFLASFFLQRLKNCFLPVFFDILVLI